MTEHEAVAWVGGGLLYNRTARSLTIEALRRHDMSTRARSRSRTRGENRRQPDTVASSSAPSEVMLTSTAWPSTPPPAQPDMLVKPIHDDIGPVGTLQAFPTADVTDVIMELIAKVKPNDLVQVEPLSAMRWRDVEIVRLPPQQAVEAYMPIDLRVSRWELYQELRHVPVMTGGRLVHTIILPWHINMDCAKHRVEERAPPNRNWLLTAVTPDSWIVHQLLLPEHVRIRLQEFDRIRELSQGGMRASPKSVIHVDMKHTGQIQNWKVDLDMTIGYFVKTIAMEEDMDERDVLIMRGTHILGAEEYIVSYMPTVQVYLIDKIVQYEEMTKDSLGAGVLWQWSKRGGVPWPKECLPVPRGLPVVFGPHQQPEAPQVLHCSLKPAHSPEELYVVHLKADATVADVIWNLQPITGYESSSMLLVQEGVVLSRREHAAVCNPLTYLLVGDQLQAADECVAQAARLVGSLECVMYYRNLTGWCSHSKGSAAT